ncbi:hypothetical protein [Pseudoduganella aquatica]|uniref:Uncharacterized protein n=1 Tax=Pseudoduganella aquatica TaxID=2660641 RepID=A0A7X4KMF4_9BURK|nr:hypothetical protein [Pseudoduganella aquatica]MYN09204.1 hypothetical protein [Pseudoduganella aquatica]
MNVKKFVVLDKSYVMASSTAGLRSLFEEYDFLLPEAFTYELAKATPEKRAKEFRKFPTVDKPFYPVPHVGVFLNQELTYHQACAKPSEGLRNIAYGHVKDFSDPKYVLAPHLAQALEKRREEVFLDTEVFLQDIDLFRAEYAHQLKNIQREEVRYELESKIVNDRDVFLRHYDQLKVDQKLNPGKVKIPAEMIDERWITYRWYQVRGLFALDLAARYPDTDVIRSSEAAMEKLRHDVLDAQYLTVASIQGSFAVQEEKIKRWWKLLCPNGDLLAIPTP